MGVALCIRRRLDILMIQSIVCKKGSVTKIVKPDRFASL